MLSVGSQYVEKPRKLGSIWRFESRQRITTDLGIDSYVHIKLLDCKERFWAELEGRFLTTEPFYSWNGCAPKVCLGPWIGTPDFPSTRHGSFVHDQLCQFFNTLDFPFNKKQVDDIFYNLMVKDGFRMAGVYHEAVKRFGCYKKDESCEQSVIVLD